MLTQNLSPLEVAACIQRMHLQELLNVHTPPMLLRACLHNTLTTSGVLDLTVVPLDGTADEWQACMLRIMPEACERAFTDIKLHPCTPWMLQDAAETTAEPESPESEASKLFQASTTGIAPTLPEMNHLSDVAARAFIYAARQIGSLQAFTRTILQSVKADTPATAVVEQPVCFTPILREMTSVTSLDFSTSTYKHSQPGYVSSIISSLPQLQAITLPVFNEAGVAPRHPRRENPEKTAASELALIQPESDSCKSDFRALPIALRSLPSLQSLVLLLSRSNSYIASLVGGLAGRNEHGTVVGDGCRVSLTRLEFIPADESYFSGSGPGSERLGPLTAFQVMSGASRFSELQQLALHVVPFDRSEPDTVYDVEYRLGQLAGLTALTKLDITYDTYKGMFARILRGGTSMVFDFLAELARAFSPLQDLKELRFFCPCGQVRPAEFAIDGFTPENTAQLEKFKEFAKPLDDLVVRGIDGDATYPFARVLKGVQSIQSIRIVDMHHEFSGCQFRNAEMARQLENLQHLTELELDLSQRFPEDCSEGMAASLRSMKHLKKLSIKQEWPAKGHSLLVQAATMTALQVRDLSSLID